MVFYFPEQSERIPVVQIHDQITARMTSIQHVISVCLPSDEAHEVPISLSAFATCIVVSIETGIANGDIFPCYGTAVTPRRVRSSMGGWQRTRYSYLKAEIGLLFNLPVEVQVTIQGVLRGFLELVVVVYAPFEQ